MEWSFIWTDFVPFSRGYFVPSLVEIGPVVLEKIFKSCQFIFIISQIYPLLEGLGPSFEKTWIPFTQGYFVPSLVEIGPVVLEKKMKMWKVYRQTHRRTDRQTTDDRWSEKLTWAFSSGELKTFGIKLSIQRTGIFVLRWNNVQFLTVRGQSTFYFGLEMKSVAWGR